MQLPIFSTVMIFQNSFLRHFVKIKNVVLFKCFGRAWACLGVLGFAYFFVVSHRVVGRTRACWGYWSVVGAGFSMYLSQN